MLQPKRQDTESDLVECYWFDSEVTYSYRTLYFYETENMIGSKASFRKARFALHQTEALCLLDGQEKFWLESLPAGVLGQVKDIKTSVGYGQKLLPSSYRLHDHLGTTSNYFFLQTYTEQQITFSLF